MAFLLLDKFSFLERNARPSLRYSSSISPGYHTNPVVQVSHPVCEPVEEKSVSLRETRCDPPVLEFANDSLATS